MGIGALTGAFFFWRMPMHLVTLPLGDIIIGTRQRKALGDLESLAASMKERLIHPIAIRADKMLVAGQRRLEAAKLLKWENIPCAIIENVDDAIALLKAEAAENTCREPLLPTEAVALGKEVESFEKPAAKERQKEHGKTAPGRAKSTSPKLGEVKPGRTTEKVGEAVGMSHATYEKAKAVVDSGDAGLAETMDNKGVHRAYSLLKAGEREAEKKAQVVKSPDRPTIYRADAFEWMKEQPPCDLLLTDPPYSTDVDDIAAFAPRVVDLVRYVKATGRAYICIGAYPAELAAYLTAPVPAPMTLAQVLAWTYTDTMGPAPKDRYKQNWQAILYYVGSDAPPLTCKALTELNSVQAIASGKAVTGRVHAWQKPDELAERFIRHSTVAGATILDPFCGTGAFLLAAARLGRKATGCDSDSAMIAHAVGKGCKRADRS